MKQLRFESDNGQVTYIYMNALTIVFFDCNNCIRFVIGDAKDYDEYKNLIPDAEQKYLKFIRNKEKVLTLRFKKGNING